MRTRCHVHRAGFTLIELLIALAILGVLSVLGYRAVASLTDSEARLAAEADRWRTLDLLFARLESDAREAVPRVVRTRGGAEAAFAGSAATDGNALLIMSRAGAEFVLEPGSAGQRIGYRMQGGNIEVVYWPAYDVADPGTGTAYRLASGIASFRIAYLDSHGAWRDRWPVTGDTATPRALRVDVQTSTGESLQRLLALR